MNKITLTDRLRYAFDNYMARGTIALIGGLAVASALVILIFSLFVWITRSADFGFGELLWMSLLRTLDSGTMGGDVGSPLYLLSMLAVTFGGIFVISALIGVLNNGLEAKLAELRKGRSRVIENGHTVILGWSPQVFSIISELVIANANQPRSTIVVLGEKDKVEMEDEIREKVGATGRTRIICRTGSPIDMADLQIAGLNTARSIVILPPPGDDPDTQVIKTLLAITNNPQRRAEAYHLVAAIREPRNIEVARMVGGAEAEVVMGGELISRIMAQTCRQSGLSVVYLELLDFGGDEIYFKAEPALAGKRFGEALLAYEDSTVIGLHPRGGQPRLNPPMDTLIRAGDRIIAISEDDDTVRLSGLSDVGIEESAIRQAAGPAPAPERTLILGWNWRVPSIIRELDNYVAAGSTVVVAADYPEGEAILARECAALKNQTVAFRLADTTDRRVIDGLAVEASHQVIVVAYSDTLDTQPADARTLVTLLHLRDIADRAGRPFSIVSEMLDMRNRALAEVTRADDFVVSDRIISLMMSQISERKELGAVLNDLFDPEGSEIYLKPASAYVALGVPVNFYTVVESARRRGQIAIGYRLRAQAGDAEKGYGVVVNPDKSKTVTFGEEDRIIVIAED